MLKKSDDDVIRFRDAVRQGNYRQHTCGIFPDNAQFNLVIIPKEFATDFKDFCQKNKVPCPLVFSSKPGQYLLDALGDIDIRSDVPMYRVYREGVLSAEVVDIKDIWQDDFVSFLIGCSFTFEYPLIQAGIKLRHVVKKKNVSMYKTDIPLTPTRYFNGDMVVSMRWIEREQIDKVIEITRGYKNFHGEPVHVGKPEAIGIADLSKPDYGEYVEGEDGLLPVFWGCGVTPQNCIVKAGLPLAITHKPGYMLVSDIDNEQALWMADQMS